MRAFSFVLSNIQITVSKCTLIYVYIHVLMSLQLQEQ